MSLIAELKRRNVFKVAAAYVVVSWLVMQITDTLGDALGLPETLAKYVFVLLVAGFPVALFLAWAYELTPEGVKKAEEVDKNQSITHVTGQKINTAITVLLVIALGYFIWESRFAGEPVAEPSQHEAVAEQDTEAANTQSPENSQASIAVLPFVNLSSDEEQEYFSDGISEELLNLLAGVQNLKVTSRTSAFSFKGKDVSIKEIASKLKVAHVLEGSVRKDGDTIRITAQLIRAADDAHLWSSTYDRKLESIFAIQDEIANAIVDALMPYLGMRAKPKIREAQSTNPEAHRLFLLGRHVMRNKRYETGLRQALDYFEAALVEDQNYAPVHAALAETWILLSVYAEMNQVDANDRAASHIKRALQLDPELAYAHAVKALELWYRNKYREAIEKLQEAIRLNPSYSEAVIWYANVAIDMGDWMKAVELTQQAYEMDPVFPVAMFNQIEMLAILGQWDEAESLTGSLWETGPDFANSADIWLKIYRGEGDQGMTNALDSLRLTPGHPGWRTWMVKLMYSYGLKTEASKMAQGYWHASVNLDLMQKKFDQAMKAALERMAANPEDEDALELAGYLYLLQQKPEQACRMFRRLWDQFDEIDDLFKLRFRAMIHYSACLQKSGQESLARDLNELIEKRFAMLEEIGFDEHFFWKERYAWLLMQNRIDDALKFLQKDRSLVGVSNEWQSIIYYDDTRLLAPEFLQDPRYMAIRKAQEERLHSYGREFLHKVCKENPWQDVWQPAEGSCEKVGAGE